MQPGLDDTILRQAVSATHVEFDAASDRDAA